MNKKSLKLKEGVMRKGGINESPNCPRPNGHPHGQGSSNFDGKEQTMSDVLKAVSKSFRGVSIDSSCLKNLCEGDGIKILVLFSHGEYLTADPVVFKTENLDTTLSKDNFGDLTRLTLECVLKRGKKREDASEEKAT
jgi:hypothetical protein